MPILDLIFSCFRIVRNKAAERAKVSYNSSTSSATGGGGGNSSGSNPPPSPPSSLTASASQGQGQHPGGGFSDALLQQRPSYSINGILGIPQPSDANANSINNKRKREDEVGSEADHQLSHQHSSEEDIKRQRSSYNGDIYANMWPTTPTQGSVAKLQYMPEKKSVH